MKHVFSYLSTLFFALTVATGAFAGEFGTKEEAMAMVKKAISHVAEAGIDKAAADFTDPNSGWRDRDLYVTVVNKEGIRLAHGQNPKLVGKSFAETMDVTGKSYGKEAMETANTKGSGWVDFMFTDPLTKKQMPKTAYIEKSGDYIYITGFYHR